MSRFIAATAVTDSWLVQVALSHSREFLGEFSHFIRPLLLSDSLGRQLYRETDKKGTSANANAQAVASNDPSPLLVNDPANTSPPPRKDSTTSLSRPKDGRAQADRNRERALVGSLTNSYKFKPDGMMKKVSWASITFLKLPGAFLVFLFRRFWRVGRQRSVVGVRSLDRCTLEHGLLIRA